MNALDQIIADALAGSPETHVAILAREVVRLREAQAVVVPEAYPGQREHIAFLGALKYELENPTPNQKPTSFDINRDYFEHYANVFSKDNERMAHGVGFMNGAEWHRQRFVTPADRVLGEGMRQVDARRFARMQFEEAERPYLLELERYVRAMAKLQNWSKDTTDHGPLSSLDRLRANQGGADHD